MVRRLTGAGAGAARIGVRRKDIINVSRLVSMRCMIALDMLDIGYDCVNSALSALLCRVVSVVRTVSADSGELFLVCEVEAEDHHNGDKMARSGGQELRHFR